MPIPPDLFRLAEIGVVALIGEVMRRQGKKLQRGQERVEAQIAPSPESTHPGPTLRALLDSEAEANRSFRTRIEDLVGLLTVRVEAGEKADAESRAERVQLREDLTKRMDQIERDFEDLGGRVKSLEADLAAARVTEQTAAIEVSE